MFSDLITLNVGADPRKLTDFIALTQELNKRFHPARPDIDWLKVHDLCLAVFKQNGADLQTLAWYVLARQQQDGIQGLNEGLLLLQPFLHQYQQSLWPLHSQARAEILTTLSQQLIAGLRCHITVYADLPQLQQAYSTLTTLYQQYTAHSRSLPSLVQLQDRLLDNITTLEKVPTPHCEAVLSTTLPSTKIAMTALASSTKKGISLDHEQTEQIKTNQASAYYHGLMMGFILGMITIGILYYVVYS